MVSLHPATAPCAPPVRSKMSPAQWKVIQEAVLERLEAVELFLADLAGKFRFESQLAASPTAAGPIRKTRQQLTTSLPSFRKRVWLASMDLTCDSDGQFWFVDDHYCCPYGLHRLHRAVSAANEDWPGHRHWKNFLQAGRQTAAHDQSGAAAVLGSATYNTVYSENHFFAEWLGLPFVTPGELRMTRTGLTRTSTRGVSLPVDTVIRRLQDDDLDPNCFQTRSFQGVRGLVAGTRRGQVSVLNAPGTGLFNNRSISRLIPDLVRFYLGTDPCLPTIPTLPLATSNVSEKDVPELVFRTSNSMDLLKPLVGRTCTTSDRERYFRLVEKEPDRFVVRQTVSGVSGNTVDARYSLRVFCVGTTKRAVLRGGLRRDCYSDGTPTAPVTRDESAVPFAVDGTSQTSALDSVS